jgi:hypothetical protein
MNALLFGAGTLEIGERSFGILTAVWLATAGVWRDRVA